MRALLSVDYALTPNVTIGGRGGMAFRGGPPSIKYTDGVPQQTTKFFPVHIEARAAYWFKALSMPGFHPYVHIGGGMAQVDGKVTVPAYRYKTVECTITDANASSCFPSSTVGAGKGVMRDPNLNHYTQVQYDAWRKMGQGFGTIGGGGVIPLGDSGGVQINLNIMFMLPSSGTVLEPSIGYVIGL